MSQEKHHSPETIQRLKDSALQSHGENLTAPDEISRRDAIKRMMAASSALAIGVAGCDRKPKRQIVSRAIRPEFQPPADAVYYSSTWTEGNFPYGMMVKTVGGRPIKIEGNPDHPVNQGSSNAQMQASILSLYDPDRLRAPKYKGKEIDWAEVDKIVANALRESSSTVLVTRSNLGPNELRIIEEFLQAAPNAKHFVHEAIHDAPRRNAWANYQQQRGEWIPRFDKAKTIISFDSDFLGTDGAVVENIRRFAEGRRIDKNHPEMSRLYVFESAMTITGSNADHRFRLRPSAMWEVLLSLRYSGMELGVYKEEEGFVGMAPQTWASELEDVAKKHHLPLAPLQALRAEIRSHPEECLVVAGPHLPAHFHRVIGFSGRPNDWNGIPAAAPVSSSSEIRKTFENGVDVALFFGVNPVYDFPGGGFADLLEKARISIGHGLYPDETVSACSLSLPSAHNLESWNDSAAREGADSICQPVISPLFDSRQESESLLSWARELLPASDPAGAKEDWHDYLKRRWQSKIKPEPSSILTNEQSAKIAWENVLRNGGEFANIEPDNSKRFRHTINEWDLKIPDDAPQGEFEVVILPHHSLHDGRFANNGWLQELPDPVSKLVWDNASAISPKTAEKLKVKEGDKIEVAVGDKKIEIAALIQPGTADGVIVLTLGHGRTKGGRIAQQAGGVNVAPLLGAEDPDTPRVAFNATVKKTAGSVKLVRTQKQFTMHGRPIVLDASVSELTVNPEAIQERRHIPDPATDLYEPYDYSKGHKWAMAIDLNACVGCSGCVTACQAENNIPIVGKKQCANGREMHWLRIDRYQEGDEDNLTVYHQPMLCQHCDNAPCENVCPVNATAHSPEGLNEMAYNRCVGTRYCANNCPYKVRRFNFLRYHKEQLRDPVQELAFNPQVTVRGVGVMEKCTFCVQRINDAKYKALNKDEDLPDDAFQTACQQACPANAIVFGDTNDPESEIAKGRKSKRAYHVLEELNIKPNVTYQAKVRNPAVEKKESKGSHNG